MLKYNRLCRIMVKDIKTKISELNIEFDFEAYWEVIYLILLTFFVGMRFLMSTMFTIRWPRYFHHTLIVIGIVLVLAHVILSKGIKAKELLVMTIIVFVFMMSYYVSGYILPVELLILILGAYRVNFRNILKTYIAVWSVLLVVTIIGAMTGLAENLVYYQGESGERVRMALGICYPTDLAAYVVFLMFAYVCVRDEYITYLEIGVMAALAGAVYYITDARTNFIVMEMLVVVVLLAKKFKKQFEKLINKKWVKGVCVFLPIVMCLIAWSMTIVFNADNDVLTFIDRKVMSYRLWLGKRALNDYGISAFGKYVLEKGFGGSVEFPDDYFFIDSSFISMGVKYGLFFLLVNIVMFSGKIYRFVVEKKILIIIVMSMITIQSLMEHHYIQYWYNPFTITIFASMSYAGRESLHIKKEEVMDLNRNIRDNALNKRKR